MRSFSCAAVAARQVLEQIGEALHEVLPAARDGFAQHFGIGQHEVASATSASMYWRV